MKYYSHFAEVAHGRQTSGQAFVITCVWLRAAPSTGNFFPSIPLSYSPTSATTQMQAIFAPGCVTGRLFQSSTNNVDRMILATHYYYYLCSYYYHYYYYYHYNHYYCYYFQSLLLLLLLLLFSIISVAGTTSDPLACTVSSTITTRIATTSARMLQLPLLLLFLLLPFPLP